MRVSYVIRTCRALTPVEAFYLYESGTVYCILRQSSFDTYALPFRRMPIYAPGYSVLRILVNLHT